MTPLLHEELTDRILRSAVAVHRALGPGLTEYSYQASMELEMAAAQLRFVGLLLNFNVTSMANEGIKRVVL